MLTIPDNLACHNCGRSLTRWVGTNERGDTIIRFNHPITTDGCAYDGQTFRAPTMTMIEDPPPSTQPAAPPTTPCPPPATHTRGENRGRGDADASNKKGISNPVPKIPNKNLQNELLDPICQECGSLLMRMKSTGFTPEGVIRVKHPDYKNSCSRNDLVGAVCWSGEDQVWLPDYEPYPVPEPIKLQHRSVQGRAEYFEQLAHENLAKYQRAYQDWEAVMELLRAANKQVEESRGVSEVLARQLRKERDELRGRIADLEKELGDARMDMRSQAKEPCAVPGWKIYAVHGKTLGCPECGIELVEPGTDKPISVDTGGKLPAKHPERESCRFGRSPGEMFVWEKGVGLYVPVRQQDRKSMEDAREPVEQDHEKLLRIFGPEWRRWNREDGWVEVGTGGAGKSHVIWGCGRNVEEAVEDAQYRRSGLIGPHTRPV